MPLRPLLLRLQRPGLPEVVVDAVGCEEPAERHLDPVADLHGTGIHVGQLALEPADSRPAMGAVVRISAASAPSAGTTKAMTWPGWARSSTSASSTPGCAVPVLPIVAVRSSTAVSGRAPTRAATLRTARAWVPV